MQASLPDWMIMPRIRSSTLTLPPCGTNILEPCIRQALSLTGSILVQLQTAELQHAVDDVGGHQLGHGGRRLLDVRILVQQRGAGVEIHDEGVFRRRVDRAERRRRRRAGGGCIGRLAVAARRAALREGRNWPRAWRHCSAAMRRETMSGHGRALLLNHQVRVDYSCAPSLVQRRVGRRHGREWAGAHAVARRFGRRVMRSTAGFRPVSWAATRLA